MTDRFASFPSVERHGIVVASESKTEAAILFAAVYLRNSCSASIKVVARHLVFRAQSSAGRKNNLFAHCLSRAGLLLVLAVQTLFVSYGVAAQDPIRVQTDEVLVPTVVFDKELYAKLNKQQPHHRTTYGKLVAKNAKLWNDIVVKNLTAKNFHLFEDNREQTIESVRLEPPAFRVIEDNLGKHPEIIGSGGGLWAYPDLPKNDLSSWLAWPQYVLAYVPSKSAPGSCHQIHVRVERANLVVWTRSEYCNTPHPASDPLNGTEFGNKLEKAANANTSSGIDLKVNVAVFADEPGRARAYVASSFPGESLQHEIRDGTLYATIGSLVLLYKEDGTLVTRYSDFACCDYGDKTESEDPEMPAPSTTGGRALLPNRYEAQFSLPPGNYMVRVVISDGVHFGVQEVPVTVEGRDPNELSITGVVVGRRARRLPQSTTEAAERVADSYLPLVSKGVEFTPTASMEFFRDDTLFTYFEINNPVVAGRSGAKILANLRILDSKSGAVADTFEPVDTTTYSNAGSSVIAVGRGVMLSHLAPGVYRLQVQANDTDGRKTNWLSTNFTVIEAAPLELGSEPAKARKR